MTIVFPFGGVAFSRGWLWVSHSFLPRRMCEHRLHSWYRLLIHPLRLNVCCNNAVIGVGAKQNLFAKYSAKFRRAITASKQFFWTLLLVFVSWFGLTSCERILFAFRCEPVCRTRPRACFVLLAAHLHSQGADILDVFGLVSSFWRLRCTSCDFSFTQQLRAHLLGVGVLHLRPTATSLFAYMSRTTEGAL